MLLIALLAASAAGFTKPTVLKSHVRPSHSPAQPRFALPHQAEIVTAPVPEDAEHVQYSRMSITLPFAGVLTGKLIFGCVPTLTLIGVFTGLLALLLLRQVQRPIRSLAVALLRAGTRVGISSRRWRSGALTVLIGEEWNAARVAQRPLVVETRSAALAVRAPPRHVDDLERRRQLFLQQMQRQQGLSMGYKSSLAAA